MLLKWYDKSARKLPWRAPPKATNRTDPYRVWLSEIMLQQTTVATVLPYFDKFTQRWPNVEDLAAAPLDDVLAAWAGLGYYARARNLHKCAKMVVERFNGAFPDTEAALLELPGVGAYTAAAIASIAHDRRAVVMDGNVERVMARLFHVETPLPAAKPELYALADSLTPDHRPGDYAQAVMDLGATICTPKTPACGICPWLEPCRARREIDPRELPRKTPKKAKPVRFGVAYLAQDNRGRVLLRARPEKGLLGGMLGLPGTEWSEAGPTPRDVAAAAPYQTDWTDCGAEARHTFTHFHLRLRVLIATITQPAFNAEDRWVAPADLGDHALPTLFKKAVRLGLGAEPRLPTA
ncbi:MAG: A/G-specific adenine glycosylase [Pseudomonadota bacterium]